MPRRSVREHRKRFDCARSIAAGAGERFRERAMMLHQRDCAIEVAGALIHVFKGTAPENALLVIPAREGEKDRQRNLAVAEVVADALAELGLSRRKIEHVVDQLKRDSKVPAELIQRGLLALRPFSNYRADSARRGKQLGGLCLDHFEVGRLSRLEIVLR